MWAWRKRDGQAGPGLGEGRQALEGMGLTHGQSVLSDTQAQHLSGLSPQPSPEEPALPWVSVKAFLY